MQIVPAAQKEKKCDREHLFKIKVQTDSSSSGPALQIKRILFFFFFFFGGGKGQISQLKMISCQNERGKI